MNGYKNVKYLSPQALLRERAFLTRRIAAIDAELATRAEDRKFSGDARTYTEQIVRYVDSMLEIREIENYEYDDFFEVERLSKFMRREWQI